MRAAENYPDCLPRWFSRVRTIYLRVFTIQNIATRWRSCSQQLLYSLKNDQPNKISFRNASKIKLKPPFPLMVGLPRERLTTLEPAFTNTEIIKERSSSHPGVGQSNPPKRLRLHSCLTVRAVNSYLDPFVVHVEPYARLPPLNSYSWSAKQDFKEFMCPTFFFWGGGEGCEKELMAKVEEKTQRYTRYF